MKTFSKRATGFTMIEMLFTAFLFTVIAGTVFSLLLTSQKRYQSESDLTTAFQQANVAIDQITRDVHSAGYPPASSFTAATASGSPQLMAVPFAWSPNYPNTPCNLGACTTPGDNDLVLEADLGDGKGVQSIRYSLAGTTLMRGVVPKVGWKDPLSYIGSDQMTPYLENVINPSTVPIFKYFDAQGGPAAQPANIQEVRICLIVQSARPDPQTGQLRSITLTGQAVRFNPNK